MVFAQKFRVTLHPKIEKVRIRLCFIALFTLDKVNCTHNNSCTRFIDYIKLLKQFIYVNEVRV